MRLFLCISIFLLSLPVYAEQSLTFYEGLKSQFKNPDGSTKWQHVANTTGSILIILFNNRRQTTISWSFANQQG